MEEDKLLCLVSLDMVTSDGVIRGTETIRCPGGIPPLPSPLLYAPCT